LKPFGQPFTPNFHHEFKHSNERISLRKDVYGRKLSSFQEERRRRINMTIGQDCPQNNEIKLEGGLGFNLIMIYLYYEKINYQGEKT